MEHRDEKPQIAPAATAVVILGKHQGTRRNNNELRGRVALAAAAWHALDDPAAPVYFLAADTHGPDRTLDGAVVRALLTERFGIPADAVQVRRWSLCTLAELRGVRTLTRRYGIDRVLVVTHGYHAPRVGRYLAEVALRGEVLSVDAETLARLAVPPACAEHRRRIAEAVAAGRVGFPHRIRERAIELGMTLLHAVDRRGRVERWLARRLRS